MLAALALVGCRTLAEDKSSAAPRVAADPPAADASTPRADGGATAAAAAPAAPELPLAWGTRAPTEGVLSPIVDGMCIHGDVYALENGPLFVYGTARGAYSRGGATTTVLVTDGGLEPQAGVGFGATFDFWGLTAMGGHYPDRLWAIVDVSSRMVAASELRFGTAGSERWKVAIDSGARFGEAGNAATEGTPLHNLGTPVPLPDGSLLIPESISEQKSSGESTSYAFRLLAPDGTLVAKPKVPGADLAKLAMAWRETFAGLDVLALANGEVLGVTASPSLKLVRWSPSRPVDDLPIRATPGAGARLVAGKARAFVRAGDQLFVYDGTKLEPAKVSSRLAPGFTFAAGENDTLYVALPSKKLLIETADGAVTEEAMPASGKLTASPSSAALWLVSDHDRALHRRTAKGWEPVPLPAPPFGNALRGPLTIESVKILAGDDVFVNTRRFEKGWGWKDPEPYRAIYRTKRPKQVLRCQDVRNEGTGRGVHAWPPSADDACKAPFVVVMREETKEPAKSYPNLASRLRGKTEYGERLSLVSFEGRGGLNLGIPMTDVEKSRSLATYLSRSLDLRADVVCGRPVALRQLDYDVAKGVVAASPAPASSQ
jgi:hypothetical protein